MKMTERSWQSKHEDRNEKRQDVRNYVHVYTFLRDFKWLSSLYFKIINRTTFWWTQ
jgi:hypothetical protein